MGLARVAVLASGRGSNFEALVKAAKAGTLQAEIVLLASDRAAAEALQKAADFGIATLVQKDPKLLAKELQARQIEWVALAGYMRLLPTEFIAAFADSRGISRIVNVHPSLLPSFPGMHSYEQAFQHGVKVTGVTVHLVDQGLDTGPICAQQSFSIEDCKSVAEVEARGLAVEHVLYPQTLNKLVKNMFHLENRGGRLHVQSR